jgi:hypothetical protein
VKTSFGPNFLAMVAKFNGQNSTNPKPKFYVLFFQTLLQSLSTHSGKVILSSSKKLFFSMATSHSFFNAISNGLK